MIHNLHKTITATQGSNKFSVFKAPPDREVAVIELHAIVDIQSIAEMNSYVDDPLMTEEQKDSLFWREVQRSSHKKLACYFRSNTGATEQKLLSFMIFNRRPYYMENLLMRFTSNAELRLQPDSELLVSIEATNSGFLTGNDRISIWGSIVL